MLIEGAIAPQQNDRCFYFSYIDRIKAILEEADSVLPTGARRAALRNRREVLLEVARQVEAGEFYGEMEPSLYGIYKMASVIEKKSEAKRVGDYLASQIVDPHDPAVRVQTFQTETLAALEQEVKRRGVALSGTEQADLGKAALGLAYSYSQLDPRLESDRTQKDFLGKLWGAQGEPDKALLGLAGEDLLKLLEEVPDDRLVTTISFLGNLLKAANGVKDLNQGGDLKDPAFLRELIKLGVEYAKLDPDTSISQEPQGWLDELWRAGSTPGAARNRAVKKGAAGLSAFLGGMEEAGARLEGVKFGQRLLKADGLLTGNGLENQKKDPKFVEALLGLGGAYAALEPNLVNAQDNPKLFLDTLWRGGNDTQTSSKAAGELAQFLNVFPTSTPAQVADHKLELLKFEGKLLRALNFTLDATSRNRLHDSMFVSGILDWGSKYILSLNDQDNDLVVNDLNGFFQAVSDGQYERGILVASNDLQDSFQQVIQYVFKQANQAIRYTYVNRLAAISPSQAEQMFARQFIPLIIKNCIIKHVEDPAQIAYILATANGETRFGHDIYTGLLEGKLEELSSYTPGSPADIEYFRGKYENDTELGNTQAGDGYKFRGRGFAQLTGRKNYRKFFIEAYPELASDPAVAAGIIVRGMQEGIITGVSLNDFIDTEAGRRDFENARKIINGKERASYFETLANQYLEILLRPFP